MPPLVSICIPTFNREQYIAKALDSARNQTFKDIEIIVVDNCSTDSTTEICNRSSTTDPRIKVFQNGSNIGLFGNCTRCVELAQGEYIKFLMSDDLLEPLCLERMLEIFDKFPSVRIVNCAQQNENQKGEMFRMVMPYPDTCLMPGRKVLKDMLLKMSNDIGAPTSVLMRKADYGEGFNQSFYFFGDFEMWSRALLRGDYYFINESLSVLRLHDKTATSANLKTLLFLHDILKLRDLYAGFMEEEGVDKNAWHQIVDDRVVSYIDYVVLEEEATADQAEGCAKQLLTMVGENGIESLLKSLVTLLHYVSFRMHELNIEARCNREQAERLKMSLHAVYNSETWKIGRVLSRPLALIRQQQNNLNSKLD